MVTAEGQKWKASWKAIYPTGKQFAVWRGERAHLRQQAEWTLNFRVLRSTPRGHLTGSTFMAHSKAPPSELGLDFTHNTQHCTVPARGLFWSWFTYFLLGVCEWDVEGSWKYKSCLWVRSSHPQSPPETGLYQIETLESSHHHSWEKENRTEVFWARFPAYGILFKKVTYVTAIKI